MPSESALFRQIVTKTNGIHGVFRRDTVTELKEIGAFQVLETIAEDRAVDTAIREQARI